ncbi:hypothetical protein EYF80_046193 [Liparis tanakae]|uniref:Uncharacterized protein n=1 Tax=Liparis tanakae TaxID=230148 RepID=A0A4Z2FRX0_9TELE|nr:hypothetical protein EYF80_046193 [Liparis tanakae]
MTNVLGIKKVYELPNPKSLLYSHDSEPLRMLKTDLISLKAVSRTEMIEEEDNSNLMFTKLISTKGSNTGFDAAGAQSDEEETHHGQHAECEEEHVHEQQLTAWTPLCV